MSLFYCLLMLRSFYHFVPAAANNGNDFRLFGNYVLH